MTEPKLVWVLTDGKAGDEQPLIGIAEALGSTPVLRHVHPRRLFAALMPWGPIDPQESERRSGAPLAPPWPDICLATGRRTVAYLRRLKRLSPQTFTVFFKDPRTTCHGADLLVVQAHDKPRGKGVMVITTAPNRILPERLAAIRAAPPAILAGLPAPRVAVLIGGDSRHHRFTDADISAFEVGLREHLAQGKSLMITASRRTPPRLRVGLEALRAEQRVHFWDGCGDNPYAAYLALADEVIVTADSTNMIGEAVATGRPVQIFYPHGGHPKISAFIAALSKTAVVGRFPNAPAIGDYAPINSTESVAQAIGAGWSARASGWGDGWK